MLLLLLSVALLWQSLICRRYSSVSFAVFPTIHTDNFLVKKKTLKVGLWYGFRLWFAQMIPSDSSKLTVQFAIALEKHWWVFWQGSFTTISDVKMNNLLAKQFIRKVIQVSRNGYLKMKNWNAKISFSITHSFTQSKYSSTYIPNVGEQSGNWLRGFYEL